MADEDDQNKATSVKLFIGAISQQLADSIDELDSRFSKYGKIISPIDLHKKPTLDTYFGYTTLEITPKQLVALRQAFNKVKFKGTVLAIETARPDYKERWATDNARRDPPPSKDQLKRKYGKPRREVDIIPGKMRKTPRKRAKYMTFRIQIGSKKTILKCPKKKLWGVMKNKKIDEMVWQYSHGQWKDGNGDIIETVDFQPVATKSGVSLIGSTSTSKDSKTLQKPESETIADEEAEEERQRNLSILDKIFGDAAEDFMPKALIDSRGNELELDENDSEKENEDDEDMADWENHSNFKKVEATNDMNPAIDNEDEDVEMAERSNKQEKEDKTSNAINSTKTLRNLFNPAENSGQFFLFGGDNADNEDFDNTVLDEINEAEKQQASIKPKSADDISFASSFPPAVAKVRKGLFFGHFESPFLSSQSQVALLPLLQFDKEAWETLFYDKRSDWAKKYKARRREALRQIEKKNKARRRTAPV